MDKLILLFKSRTFWSLVVLFVYNGFIGISPSLPSVGVISDVVNALGFLLISYFHVNPSQNYKD